MWAADWMCCSYLCWLGAVHVSVHPGGALCAGPGLQVTFGCSRHFPSYAQVLRRCLPVVLSCCTVQPLNARAIQLGMAP